MLVEALVADVTRAKPDQREILRQQAVATKIPQRRHEKAAREIAGPAEDHENARRRWLCYVTGDRGHLGSTWPPKAGRIADGSLFVFFVWS